VLLVEMIVDEYPNNIDYCAFCVPDATLEESDWQVAYMEQYLNLDGMAKLCDVYQTPTPQTKPSRIVFFLFKTDVWELSTPYGKFSLTNPQKTPDRLVSIVEFETFD